MIIYATNINNRGILAVTSADGRVKQRLSEAGDVREPSWGPAAN
jgi:TolB protein